jgi:hypothetical protein
MYIEDAKNKNYLTIIEGKEYIKFETGGKYKHDVIVDVHTWENYLHKHHWTAVRDGGKEYKLIKASINKHSKAIYRMIIENEYDEVDYWGNTIDHKNNDTFDNRLENLRIVSSKLNNTNRFSKYTKDGMNLIYPQYTTRVSGEKVIHGYKLHTNIFDETVYKYFNNVEEAKDYRDNVVLPYIEQKIEELIKKTRDIEFERGLKQKIENNEIDEIYNILKKYKIIQ